MLKKILGPKMENGKVSNLTRNFIVPENRSGSKGQEEKTMISTFNYL